jgi:hypothetical protein
MKSTLKSFNESESRLPSLAKSSAKGVQLPAAINFAHYTHGTGQVRSNAFINSPWQLREFKTDINSKGEAVFVADSVKSNPLAELFAKEGSLDSDSLKDLRVDFIRDFSGYVDNLSIIFMVNNSVLTTMLTTAGTEVKTVEYCSW